MLSSSHYLIIITEIATNTTIYINNRLLLRGKRCKAQKTSRLFFLVVFKDESVEIPYFLSSFEPYNSFYFLWRASLYEWLQINLNLMARSHLYNILNSQKFENFPATTYYP